eukprot:jgi/Picsp_1/4765/NSC_02133-R1_riboflavin biosynthesis protein
MNIEMNSLASRCKIGRVHLHSGAHRCRNRLVMMARGGVQKDVDAVFMKRALELAKRGLGKTWPNPAVGCVIVSERSGEDDPVVVVVGEGYHPKAGMPHAEVYALRGAGEAARGGTAYVTLEPCDHYGRTPPCSQALVDAGVARVVVGVRDPNPLVDGGGIQRLRDAGVEVLVGCEEEACFEMNREFMERMAA